MKRGKHYIDSKKLIDSTKLYESGEAIALAVQTAKSKFDDTSQSARVQKRTKHKRLAQISSAARK